MREALWTSTPCCAGNPSAGFFFSLFGGPWESLTSISSFLILLFFYLGLSSVASGSLVLKLCEREQTPGVGSTLWAGEAVACVGMPKFARKTASGSCQVTPVKPQGG